MLNAWIRFSLNNRLFVLAISAFIIGYGSITTLNLPIDVLPDITKPTVSVLTESHGMAPEEVETRVTYPIESYLNGLPGVERIRSQSGIGLSAIQVEFQWGTDIYRNRQLVQEKLNLAKERLPKDISPRMGPVGSLLGQIQQIALSSTDTSVSPLELRSLAEWVIRPRLMTVPGVSQVISIGGGLKQYQVLVSAEKMNMLQLSIAQMDHELSQISQNTTGGFLEKNGQEYLVRNIGVVEGIDDIKDNFVGLHFGRPVLLGEIAEVIEAPKLKRGDGSFNGKPAVIMTIIKQPGSPTVNITRAIDRAIDELRPSLPKNINVNTNVFKQSHFIETSIDGVVGKLKYGSLLVFIILFIFLSNLRMSLITLTAIPLSFLVTFISFRFFGLSVNTMTLGGLAIAIGELVDDSFVDVENVFRRLGENATSSHPKSRLRVIYEASSEVRNSIMLATLIIGFVFLPLFSLGGIEGRLFLPLGFSYLTALIASLVVSLTVTPVLCYYLLDSKIIRHKDNRFVTRLKAWDGQVLYLALLHSRKVILASLALFLGSLLLLPLMGRDFLPKFNEGTALISLIATPGISLQESNKIGLKAEQILLSTPEVASVSRRTGRAEFDEHVDGVNVSDIGIDFKQGGRPKEVVLNDLRERLKKEIPGIGVNVGQPISHLIDHMMSGVSAEIAIKIYGSDLTVLRQKSIEMRDLIKGIPGLVDLRIEHQGLVPQVKIHVMRKEAAQYGLSAGEVTELLEAAFNGVAVAQVMDQVRIYDVFFQFDQDSRSSLEKMQNTILKVMPDGRKVFLKDVADVYETMGPNEISRENGQRRIIISANASGRDLGSIIKDIKDKVDTKLKLPTGYYIVYGGQFESQQSATKNILLFGILSLVGIAFLLYNHFRSHMIVIQIMLTLPLAFVGGIALLFLMDRTITVASLVGFITLCGIASRNAIMMISHYLHLMKMEGESFSREMIVRGSQERLVPVLVTASVASLALLPLVFAKGQPGTEVLHPVAVVIVGGLLSSTLLDIIVTPVLFFRFGKKSAEAYVKIDKKSEKLSQEPL